MCSSLFRRLLFVSCVVWIAGCSQPTGEDAAGNASPEAAAELFFKRCAESRFSDAYRSAATKYRITASADYMASVAKTLGLNKPEHKATWRRLPADPASQPHLEQELRLAARFPNEMVVVEGVWDFNDRFGKPFLLNVSLVREGGVWRFESARTRFIPEIRRTLLPFHPEHQFGDFAETVQTPVPDKSALELLTRVAVAKFANAINDRSFEEFRDWVSPEWSKSLTVAALDNEFSAFIEKRVDMQKVTDAPIEFSFPPYVNPDGLLICEGSFRGVPVTLAGEFAPVIAVVQFSLQFHYDIPRWRLFGITVNVKKEVESKGTATLSPRPNP